jgi:hypothetical protein
VWFDQLAETVNLFKAFTVEPDSTNFDDIAAFNAVVTLV